jgi:EAL domain-containing protein (putative c-di-GMP-specific phosphodiesterase class I)
MATDLRAALAAGELQLAYQPIFDASGRRVVSVEALLRWERAGQGPVAPSAFVPVAEETGLMDELGSWALRQACRDALDWSDISLSVNVSPAQFRNPDFAGFVSAALEDVGFPARRLQLEITETYLMSSPGEARRVMESVRKLGIAVVLDDFGTGYSSIGYLRRFTFDKLKLDRSLIAGIVNDLRIQNLVQATVALGQALNLVVTAEGVESESEAVLLRLAGCSEFQGFFFAKPCSAEEFAARYRDGQPDLPVRASA